MPELNVSWYRLADGTQADPGDCSKNDKGVLVHKNGVPVALDSDGKPVEIAREPELNKTKMAADAGKPEVAKTDTAAQPVAATRPVGIAPAVQPPKADVKPADASKPHEPR